MFDGFAFVWHGSNTLISALVFLRLRIKDNPPAKDNLSTDECEHIVLSMIVERILDIAPFWNAHK
jgi:hypothetical protein